MPSTAASPQAAEFIRALALAWKNLAAYPPGHPALAGALEHVHRRLTELRGASGEVVFGVASDGLTYGSEKIESLYAQKFAQALYGRGVAVLRFEPATSQRDLETFLRLVGVGAGGRTPIWEEVAAAGIKSVILQPVDYSGVRLTDNMEAPQKTAEASLWDEILRALVAGHELSPAAKRLLEGEIQSVDQLTSLILRYMDEVAKEKPAVFDPNATFGVRFETLPQPADTPEAMQDRMAEAIGDYVADSSTADRQQVLQQVIQLIRSLPDPLRGAVVRSVLGRLATDESSSTSLADFAKDVPAEELLAALRHLASMGDLSSYALKLMQSLAAMSGPSHVAAPVDPNLITDLVQLFGEEDADRFNPPDHADLLEHVAINIPYVAANEDAKLERLGSRAETIADDAINRQLGLTLLDLLTRFGSALQTNAVLLRAEKVFRGHLSGGQFGDALDFIERLQGIAEQSGSAEFTASIQETLARLASDETIDSLVHSLHAASPEQSAVIQRLIEIMGTMATRTLLMALAAENNRSRRRRLLNFVGKLGPSIVPEVLPFLSDSRWYVVRNMIVLLRNVNDRTSLPQIRELAHHPDLRVRLEAIRTLMSLDSTVSRTLLEQAINDPDPKLAEKAITLVGSYGIKEGVEPLLKIVSGKDIFFTRKPIRLRAIKALGELAEPRALKHLQPFFTDSILPWPAREERRAAYESLAGYPSDSRVPFVEKGLKSRDPHIREICRRLTES